MGFFAEDASIEDSSSELADALAANGDVDVVRLALDQTVWGKSSGGRIHPPNGAPYDVTLLHVPPHRTAEALATVPVAVRGGRVVAWWWWDLAHLHLGGASGFGDLDEIWVPSRFVQRAVEPLADVPVRLVPPAISRPSEKSAARSLHGERAVRDESLLFYFSFDAADVVERANPFALLELWRRLARETRPDGPAPILSVRIDRAGRDTELVEALRHQAAESDPLEIVIHDDPAVPESALLASSDVWISLDRGSAVGLRSVRAALLGKPVLATGHGGVTEFLTEETGFPIDFEPLRLDRHEGPFPAGAVWADPDLDDALEQIWDVLGDPASAARRGGKGRARAEEIYGRRPAGERLTEALVETLAPAQAEGRGKRRGS